MLMQFRSLVLWASLCVLLTAFTARAQPICNLKWLPGSGIPGTNGPVHSIISWDPDGAGPRAPFIVAGGAFSLAESTSANNIAVYDPASGQWTSLGSGLNGTVMALAVAPNGDLIAGGGFQSAGSVSTNFIARWNGTSWSPLGAGMNGPVRALAVLNSGEIAAGGTFTTAGGIPANRIASWDGTTWRELGSGMDGPVVALTVFRNGQLIAGGYFTSAGGVDTGCIARWNGQEWRVLTARVTGHVDALAMHVDGRLIAAGAFVAPVAIPYIARIAFWNDVSWANWSTWDYIAGGSAYAVALVPNVELLLGGDFQTQPNYGSWRWFGALYRWNGDAARNTFNNTVRAITVLNATDAAVGGDFSINPAINSRVNHIMKWRDFRHISLGSGVDREITGLLELPSGNIVALGAFQSVRGEPSSGVARWDASGWSPIVLREVSSSIVGASIPGTDDVVVGGGFVLPGQAEWRDFALWNGATWTAFGPATLPECSAGGCQVSAIAARSTSDIYAAMIERDYQYRLSATRVIRWNGTNWQQLGASFGPQRIMSIALLSNGEVVAGGDFFTGIGAPANYIARWNGTTWQPLGTGMNGPIKTIIQHPNGDLIVGGSFTLAGGVTVNRIARWDGIAWHPYGPGFDDGEVRAITVMPNGEVIAGGSFTMSDGEVVSRIARWNGSSWLPIETGMDGPVSALAHIGSDLYAGGDFRNAGGRPSAFFARATIPQTPVSFVLAADAGFGLSYLPGICPLPSGEFLRFGGRTVNNVDLGRTAVLRNGQWTQLTLAPSPIARADHAMAVVYGPGIPSESVVMFGGKRSDNVVLSDCWKFAEGSWTQIYPSGTPLARGGHAMAFNFGSPVMFGGFNANGSFVPPDTHKLDLSSNRWIRLSIPGPSARFAHAMAFDYRQRKVVLFGGVGASGFLGDTWVLDTVTDTWTQLSGSGPSPRQYPSMHWDEHLGGVRLVGGRDATNTALDDQWLLTATGWQLLPEHLPGGPRWAHASAATFDGKQVIVGGLDVQGNVRSDTLISTTAPVIRQEPQSLTRSVNQTAIFNVISNDPNASYQWYLDALPIIDSLRITGSASPQLTISGVTLADAGAYTVSISNCGGTTTSTPATLTATTCDPIDFNNNSLFPEDQDLIDFFSVLAGGSCSPGNTCNDIDFNNDGLFPDDNDLVSFLRVLAGGAC